MASVSVLGRHGHHVENRTGMSGIHFGNQNLTGF